MAEVNEIDVVIDRYLDGRMPPQERAAFEDRMAQDPELRARVLSATQSVEMIQQALGWVTPGEEFDEQVSSKIISISQTRLRPMARGGKAGAEAVLKEPDAACERRRLILIGIIAIVIFIVAAFVIGFSLGSDCNPEQPASEVIGR